MWSLLNIIPGFAKKTKTIPDIRQNPPEVDYPIEKEHTETAFPPAISPTLALPKKKKPYKEIGRKSY